MQMRTCGSSGCPQIPDRLSLTDIVARGDRESGHMRIYRRGVSVVDYYIVAVAAVGGRGNNNAACRRDYGCAVVAEAIDINTAVVSGVTG